MRRTFFKMSKFSSILFLPVSPILRAVSLLSTKYVMASAKAQEFRSGTNIPVSLSITISEFPPELVANATELLQNLQVLRDACGKSITIISGYRSPERNKAVGYQIPGVCDPSGGGSSTADGLQTRLHYTNEHNLVFVNAINS